MDDNQPLVIRYRTLPRWVIPLCVAAGMISAALWVGLELDNFHQERNYFEAAGGIGGPAREFGAVDNMAVRLVRDALDTLPTNTQPEYYNSAIHTERVVNAEPFYQWIHRTFGQGPARVRTTQGASGQFGYGFANPRYVDASTLEGRSYGLMIWPHELDKSSIVSDIATFQEEGNYDAFAPKNNKAGANFIIAMLTALMAVPILAGLIVLVGRDTGLILRKEGVSFPMRFALELRGKINRSWEDICAISLEDSGAQSGGEDHQKNIRIYFKSGGSLRLNLASMSKADLESLLLGLERWGNKCALAPELIALRYKLLSKNTTGGAPGHTAIWEEELRFHFAATNFIPLSVGRTLQSGKHKVVMQMAASGLAAVYLAEHGDRVVILKEAVVPPATDEKIREKAKELFKREAQFLLKLDHPKIAKVLDHFVEDNRDYLVLEYIPGRSLREVVKRDGPQSRKNVLKWALQIADILDYLHNQNPPMIHRDLTPDNLVLTLDGDIHLIDFGAANEFVGAATGTFIGKQLYISPEQFRGKAQPASDLYSLGATLHYMLTGKEPDALSVSHPRTINADLSEDLDALVARCTQLEVENRFATASELTGALKQLDESQDQPEDPGQTISIKEKVLEGAS